MMSELTDRYPREHQLEDSARITFSLMSSEDRVSLSKFVSRLTRLDLLYLQIDITKEDVLQRWFDTIDQGDSFCICTYDPKHLVGYASIQISNDLGEIRVNIDQGYRSRGLGKALISEIFFVAKRLNLRAVTARMLTDQYGAISAFQRLGFEKTEILENYVIDGDGQSKDLLLMTSSLI